MNSNKGQVPAGVIEVSWEDTGFVPWDGTYEKQFYDVMFPNGNIFEHLWPNAGMFIIPAEMTLFKRERWVTPKDKVMIRVSEEQL